MELLLLPSRATVSRRLLPTAPLRRASSATFRPAASSSGNVEATTDATATTSVAKTGQEWRAGGRQGQAPFGLGLDLSEEMRRGMMWRMLAFPAAAVAAEAALLWALDSGVDAPAWAGKAGSAVLFAAGLLGSQYGFFSSRWDAAETGSVVGWELAARHWNALSMARGSSMEEEDEEDDEEWEWVYEEDEEETDD
ncbi:hypothetical protein ACQJBY_057867 [Aegilops geniculata]